MLSQGKIRKKGVHVEHTPHMHTFFAESLAQAEQLPFFYQLNTPWYRFCI